MIYPSAASREKSAERAKVTAAMKLEYFKRFGQPLGDETGDFRGSCQLCGANVLMSVSHNHHKIKRSAGGSDEPENRIILDPACHSKAHRERAVLEAIQASESNISNGEIIQGERK
jgi:5-methylcytosine-specific restriction endonuclease McrA